MVSNDAFSSDGLTQAQVCVRNGRHHPEDPIAVCGFALKFPQDAPSEKAFWSMLVEKRTAFTEYPPERLNVDAFQHSTRNNALRARGAHFLKEDLGLFDANFFSINPTEAAAMDPMQRNLLETTYKAFENAGIRLEDIQGSRASVHTGCFTNDYLQQILKDSDRLPPYAAVGATQSMLANRLSWFFDLHGPSVNLDSACSSSAMAVDLSCQLLRSGVTDTGVVAGCNLLLDPDFSIILSNMQMLSPDGHCYTFDDRANGYSRGEGVAAVILKRLSDALRDNDNIRAVIRATGTNQDGRTPGITQPDSQAQAQLIRETYERAQLSMKHTRFFEAHGTGTAIGDPIEVGAIAGCFEKHRGPSDPLLVGSVKTNIGHLEGASGIAGLIKAVLVVESGLIPPNANFQSINRRLSSYDRFMVFPTQCQPWPACEIRRASINSFGYGGTNTHVVIDDTYSYLHRRGLLTNNVSGVEPYRGLGEAIMPSNGTLCVAKRCMRNSAPLDFPKLLVWSGAIASSTQALIGSWESYCLDKLDHDDRPSIPDIAYTLDSRRSFLPVKSFAVVTSLSDLPNLNHLASTPVESQKESPRIAFIFTGQGAQWHAMGRELLRYPEFAQSIQLCEDIISKLGCTWSPRGTLPAVATAARLIPR
jgi:acyl transferase domain-containing protein